LGGNVILFETTLGHSSFFPPQWFFFLLSRTPSPFVLPLVPPLCVCEGRLRKGLINVAFLRCRWKREHLRIGEKPEVWHRGKRWNWLLCPGHRSSVEEVVSFYRIFEQPLR